MKQPAKPVAKPASKPASKPTVKPTVKPTKPTKPVAKPITKPVIKPAAKKAKKAKKAKSEVPVVPVKTVHSSEVQPVASMKVEYTPVLEVPAMKTEQEKELYGLMAVTHEMVLERLRSMLQQYCTLCFNGKATLVVRLFRQLHP